MEPIAWNFLSTLGGAIVGASTSIFVTYLQNKKAMDLQSSENIIKQREISREFQRSNLLKIQDSLVLVTRSHFQGYLEDLRMFKQDGGFWGKQLLGENISESMRSSLQEYSMLSQRVTNDALREKLLEFRSKAVAVTSSSSQEHAESAVSELLLSADEIANDIGSVLRTYLK